MPQRVRRLTVCAGLLVFAFGSSLAAQLGSRPASDWIAMMERPERVAGLRVEETVAAIELQPGQVAADIGAGPGIFSLALAKAVGPKGKVYAEEVDPAFVDRINQKLRDAHIANVVAVLGEYADPKLPEHDVDVAFFHDVLHHVQDRAGFLKKLAGYMKPDSRIAIVEYDAKTGPHRAQPELQITREQLDALMAEAGFGPLRQVDGLYKDARWFMIYARR